MPTTIHLMTWELYGFWSFNLSQQKLQAKVYHDELMNEARSESWSGNASTLILRFILFDLRTFKSWIVKKTISTTTENATVEVQLAVQLGSHQKIPRNSCTNRTLNHPTSLRLPPNYHRKLPCLSFQSRLDPLKSPQQPSMSSSLLGKIRYFSLLMTEKPSIHPLHGLISSFFTQFKGLCS